MHSKTQTQLAYQAYLGSSVWKQKRKACLHRDRHRCRNCGTTENLQIHHIKYSKWGTEKLKDLITLCSKCHFTFHKGHKLSISINVKKSNKKKKRKKSKKIKVKTYAPPEMAILEAREMDRIFRDTIQ